ncbi:MAG: Uma2 family endonuclease [Candidatus Riflebacteria bacterium]|nr:Uma2 family endonuclease [Candidatus Riflebacteria bacterium]
MTTLSHDRLERETTAPETVEYPESDGEPIGETDFHISNILYLRQALRRLFRKVDDLYVAANMLFYYEEGNPSACRVPDVFVVRGVAKHDRRTFKLWVEGKVPCLIVEVTSKKSQVEDLWIKRRLYEKLGVTEYLLFDPLGEYLDPMFQAFALEAEQYVPASLGEGGGYRSRVSGVEFRPIGSMLRAIDPESGRPVPDLDEAMDEAEAESQRAEAESQRAEAESQRAEAEARRAQQLEEELRHYRERYGRHDKP